MLLLSFVSSHFHHLLCTSLLPPPPLFSHFIFLYLPIRHYLLPPLPPSTCRSLPLSSHIMVDLSCLIFISLIASSSSQCINSTPDIIYSAWKLCPCLRACGCMLLSTCKCAIMCVRLVKTVKTSLGDTLLQLCPLSSNTSILKQVHMCTRHSCVCVWLCMCS